MTDISKELSLITSQLSEKLEKLESEFQRWTDYKTDYDALEVQLNTLPDTTTKKAMIPLGKLAFMPGQIIHTNEILVLLGDQYYAERSAKQAVEILGRRREVVNENLRLVEAQLNSFKQKTSSIMSSSSALSNTDPQINEEGLPIMDIREELPDNYEEEQKKKKKSNPPIQSTPSSTLPESVLRAREMMKAADEKINQKKKASEDTENKALFDLLRELEEEEEEEEGNQEVPEPVVPTTKKTSDEIKHRHNGDTDENDSDHSDFSDDSEDDDRYDTEISENMFDRFGDDEQYPLDGIVDQEDFTAYDEITSAPQVIPAAAIKEIVEEEDYERSTPKIITKRKTKPPAAEKEQIKENPFELKVEPTKKLSKFKQAQLQQQKESMETNVKENVVEESVPDVASSTASTVAPKKFSKFKLLRQQQQPRNKAAPALIEEKVKEIVKESVPVSETLMQASETPKASVEEEFIMSEPKVQPSYPVQDNGIPKVVSNKPKKMSRFKLSRQKTSEPKEEALSAPVQAERIKPKRTVTWDSDISVRDHDTTMAPSVVSETTSYSEPMKHESTQKKTTMGSLFKQMRQQPQTEAFIDDYPSLDDDNDTKVDLNELVKAARESSDAFWRPDDGSDALIPMVKSTADEEEDEEEPSGIIVAKKTKLDNKIMKGAVMERDIVPVDLEQVEDEMDLREITTNYQQMRQNMLASTGGFSFAQKPEFEVFDEELPIPKKPGQQEEEIEEIKPKKMSRFKAARLGMRMDAEEQ